MSEGEIKSKTETGTRMEFKKCSMVRVAFHFVGDSSDLRIYIPKFDAFCGEIKRWEYDSVIVVNWFFSVSVGEFICW